MAWRRPRVRAPSAPLKPMTALEVEVGAHEFRNHFGYYMERVCGWRRRS